MQEVAVASERVERRLTAILAADVAGYAEAIAAFGRVTAELDVLDYVYLVASYGQSERLEQAQAQSASCQARHPDVSLLQHAGHEPYNQTADLDHLLEGLRKAGLTE